MLVGFAEYQRLCALDDQHWLARAARARAGGYATHEEAMELIASIRDGDLDDP